ncbi:MAG: phosphoribosylanthranilate isomerase [Deltaproteobacteria bacterium]|nr:MAG: phosphoribosylanthranilate isomerase [Deltaproteobacteria bacterium]
MIVKICGVRRPEDAAAAARAGADWIGINLWRGSRRYCDPAAAKRVAAAARAAGSVHVVGVFVNATAADIARAVADIGLDRVQLHGDETPAFCAALPHPWLKAIALSGDDALARLRAYGGDLALVDTPTAGYGGSGRTGDWSLAARAAAIRRVLLAGGLTPDNVAAAIRAVRPHGVDVAGGVEREPGVKDPAAMAAFVRAARSAL